MSNPTVTLTDERIARLQRIGHLHCPVNGEGTFVTLELDEPSGGDA